MPGAKPGGVTRKTVTVFLVSSRELIPRTPKPGRFARLPVLQPCQTVGTREAGGPAFVPMASFDNRTVLVTVSVGCTVVNARVALTARLCVCV
jgi:hypothetical protein